MIEPKPLPWKTNQFPGFLSTKALDNHYDANYRGYINKLNSFMVTYPELQSLTVREISDNYPMIRPTANQILNHEFFWNILSPEKTLPTSAFYDRIQKSFHSYDRFQLEFIEKASSHFGSGWIWLVYDPINTLFQLIDGHDDYNPVNDGYIPIITLDVWEHSFYLDYVTDKQAYARNFFHYINWKYVDSIILSIFA